VPGRVRHIGVTPAGLSGFTFCCVFAATPNSITFPPFAIEVGALRGQGDILLSQNTGSSLEEPHLTAIVITLPAANAYGQHLHRP